jgi:hypothetical protein
MKKFLSIIFINLIYISTSYGTPLTSQEKFDFQRSSVPACIAKQNASRNLTAVEKDGVVIYCNCHASVMASLATREEMSEFNKGKLPSTFEPKVIEARSQCIKSLSR